MILDHFVLSHICDNCPERVKVSIIGRVTGHNRDILKASEHSYKTLSTLCTGLTVCLQKCIIILLR